MFNEKENTPEKKVFDNSVPQDQWFEHMWLKGNRERFLKRQWTFYTETLPTELKRLERIADAFSKIKLNERDLPW